MKTRQEALDYGLSFPNTYQEAPFHDPNWQLIRVKDSKKVFLCHPRLAPEQGQLEYHHSRWQHTG